MRSALWILSISAVSAIAWARPNDLKAVFIEDNEIPADKKVLKKGVAASFGGYQASAGLGGGPNGGALFASAGAPEAGAAAGIGSYGQSSAGASAGVSTGFDYGGRPPRPIGQYGDNGFFDRIFAIPINVLHSVNDYVKTKASQGQGVYIENGSGSAGAAVSQNGAAASANTGAAASANTGAGIDASTGLRFGGSSEEAAIAGSSASASSGAYAGASASAGAGSGSGFKHGPGGRPDYDRIFNIPISALRSVNDFLNG